MANPFGRQHRRAQRRADKEQKAVFDDSLLWTPDPNEPVDEFRESEPVNATTRISQRTVTYRRDGKIIEFAVVLSTLNSSGEWDEILCIDSCNHGSVHVHRNGNHSDPPEIIEMITNQEVLQNQYWEAIGAAYNEATREKA